MTLYFVTNSGDVKNTATYVTVLKTLVIVMYVTDFFEGFESKLKMFITSCGAGCIIYFSLHIS
jgi:hypothetical protein